MQNLFMALALAKLGVWMDRMEDDPPHRLEVELAAKATGRAQVELACVILTRGRDPSYFDAFRPIVHTAREALQAAALFADHNLVSPGVPYYASDPYSPDEYAAKTAWIGGQLDRMAADIAGFQEVFQRGALVDAAWESARKGRGHVVTVSRNVFIPLTNLCRNRCSYCTFAKMPDSPLRGEGQYFTGERSWVSMVVSLMRLRSEPCTSMGMRFWPNILILSGNSPRNISSRMTRE